jgi:ornithine cyclodeaminase
MLVLSRSDILSVFSMRDAIEADKKAFVLHSQGKCRVPLRINFDAADEKGQYLFMPAYAGGIDRAGIKIVSVFPGNAAKGRPSVPATVVLLDNETGEVAALIEGTTLTQLRTAAIAGVATELLARPDSSVGALFGTGGQASAQLEAILTVRSLKEVRVFDISPERVEAFIKANEALAGKLGARLSAAPSSDGAVDGADVITAVTTATKPVFDGTKVKAGAHVNGIGAYTPAMQELPPEVIERAGRVYVDNSEAVLAEAGDLIKPMKEGRFGEEIIAGELGQLILGEVEGRRSAEEITVMKTVGFASLDVVTAYEIVEKAQASGVGKQIDL